MNIYDAIMKAAEHIEQNPKLFDYWNSKVPECGTPGCALGWIGHFAGVEAGMRVGHVEEEILGRGDLYYLMADYARGWTFSAEQCASGLRKFALLYKPVTPPDWNAIAARQTVGTHERSQELSRA